MADGYCTLDDVRRALREAKLPGDAIQDQQIAVDAIAAQTEWLEKTLKRHWYVPGGIGEDSVGLIPTSTNNRDDEHSIPTHGGFVVGADGDAHITDTTGTVFDDSSSTSNLKEKIRLSSGDLSDETIPTYTRIRLDRRDVKAVNELHVVNADGGYDDWVASNDYSGGVGNQFRGDEYWVRINNDGWSELYLDVHAIDDDLASLSNAVYIDIDYGHEGLPRTARRAVAFRAASDLVEDAVIEIPQNATLYNIETKAEELRDKAEELLSV